MDICIKKHWEVKLEDRSWARRGWCTCETPLSIPLYTALLCKSCKGITFDKLKQKEGKKSILKSKTIENI